MGRPVRIGIIVVSVNTILEPELSRVAPEGVELHFTRAGMRGGEAEYQRMVEGAPDAAELLADAKVDVIVFACTAASTYRGPGKDQEIVTRIEARTGIPALSTAGAVLQAFEALGMKRIGLGSPYDERTNQLEELFFRGSGVEVLRMKGLNCPKGGKMALIPPEEVYRTALSVNSSDCDGVFLSCTNWPTLKIIEALEKEIGKPVTSSNQATLWAALRMAGVTDLVPGFGRLLRQ